ncbi:MAG: hypothetical protein ACRDJ4_04785 [Actinomycetota bacterium]
MSRLAVNLVKRATWDGEAAYRMLSYPFFLRWSDAGLGEHLRKILGVFEVPHDPWALENSFTPGYPARYSLLDLGRPGRMRYRLLNGDYQINHSVTPDKLVRFLLWHLNTEALRRTGDFLLVHAGAVVTPGGEGVLLPGASGAGKTTLVAGLVRSGFGYLSDEAGAVDPVSHRLFPYPKALTFKYDPLERFPDLRGENGRVSISGDWHVRPDDLRPGAVAGACEVRYLIFPRYLEGAQTTLSPLTPGAATIEVGRNTLNMNSCYRERALPLLADLARAARSYRLVSGKLEEAVEAVASLTGSRVLAGPSSNGRLRVGPRGAAPSPTGGPAR